MAARTYSCVMSMRLTPSSSVDSATGTCASAVKRKRVLVALDAQNAFVRAQVDLDHHVLLRQFLQQPRRIVLIHHIHAVPDAFGVAQLHRLPDVEAQPLRRHQPRRQLAGVQGDVAPG